MVESFPKGKRRTLLAKCSISSWLWKNGHLATGLGSPGTEESVEGGEGRCFCNILWRTASPVCCARSVGVQFFPSRVCADFGAESVLSVLSWPCLFPHNYCFCSVRWLCSVRESVRLPFLGVDCRPEGLALPLLPQIRSGDQRPWWDVGLALHAQQTHNSTDNSLGWSSDTFHYFCKSWGVSHDIPSHVHMHSQCCINSSSFWTFQRLQRTPKFSLVFI